MVLSTKISPHKQLEIGIVSFRYVGNIPSNLHTCFSFSMASLILLDKMLINYTGNSSMLRIYKKILKSHDRKDVLSSKLSDKCKKGFL